MMLRVSEGNPLILRVPNERGNQLKIRSQQGDPESWLTKMPPCFAMKQQVAYRQHREDNHHLFGEMAKAEREKEKSPASGFSFARENAPEHPQSCRPEDN